MEPEAGDEVLFHRHIYASNALQPLLALVSYETDEEQFRHLSIWRKYVFKDNKCRDIRVFFSVSIAADDYKNSDVRAAKEGNPMIALHPAANQKAADAYYKAVEKNVFNGAIPLKYAQLAAISASVAAKCLYCIPAHTAMAKAAGASDEEIKTAVAVAADVALNSSMLYGNQFDMDEFLEMFPQ